MALNKVRVRLFQWHYAMLRHVPGRSVDVRIQEYQEEEIIDVDRYASKRIDNLDS